MMLLSPYRFVVAGSAFSPNAAFFAGSPGASYDLSAVSGLYQDSARTTLVTTAGQGIGSVTDLSGNSKHAAQATTASKPSWQTTYASFDGFDDFWQTPAIDFSTTDEITVVLGIRKLATGSTGMVMEFSPTVGNAGTFGMQALDATTRVIATGASSLDFVDITSASPVTSVIAATYNLGSTPPFSYRVNGATAITGGGALGARNFLNDVLNIGRRNGASFEFSGRIYRMIVIGRLLTAGELADAETWCNATTLAY